MNLDYLRNLAADQELPWATVAVEVLHLVILDALFSLPESTQLHFQGGTCIHLVHGGYRFSEDLDFASSRLDCDYAKALIDGAKSKIEKGALSLFGAGDSDWKLPKTKRPSNVKAYWFRFKLEGSQLPRLRVKIEFAQFPVYRAGPAATKSELDILNRQPLISALPAVELLAEKITAVFGRPYLKGRDVFDLWYLTDALETEIDPELLGHKLEDYSVPSDRSAMTERVEAVANANIAAEMDRFLPARYRRQLRGNGYEIIRKQAQEVTRRALDLIEPDG